MGISCMYQESQTGSLYQPRGVWWEGRQEGDSKGIVYTYTCGWLLLRFDRKYEKKKKEWNYGICSNIDGPSDYHTKWNKPENDKCHMIYVKDKRR